MDVEVTETSPRGILLIFTALDLFKITRQWLLMVVEMTQTPPRSV